MPIFFKENGYEKSFILTSDNTYYPVGYRMRNGGARRYTD